jgi:hypothetical protein
MAFDPSPTGYFPNINVSGVISGVTGVFIPYSDLESYDITVATSASGDIRQLIYSFVEAVTDRMLSLNTSDRPNQVAITRTSVVPNDTTIRKNYGFTINVALGPTEVIPE